MYIRSEPCIRSLGMNPPGKICNALSHQAYVRLLILIFSLGSFLSSVETLKAAIVCSGPVNINIPSNLDGIYLNVITGVSGGLAPAVPGWDVNPWNTTTLNMFTPTPSPGGGTSVGTGSNYFNLAPGTLIGPASTFSNTGTTTISPGTPLTFNSSNNLIGFRFINEPNGNAVHYGWMRISLSGTASTQPRAIVEYAYENVAGTAIEAGSCISIPPLAPQPPFEPGTESRPFAAPNQQCDYKDNKANYPPPDRNATDPILLFAGEVHETAVDLRIPGRGMDFVWSRTYRSKSGSNTAQGNNWDLSYNIRVAAGGGGTRNVHDGNSRIDNYSPIGGGIWAKPEFFRELRQNPDSSYTLTFEDTGRWNFNPLNGTPAQGKISSIVDRNNNTISFAYDGSGRLAAVVDTLGRNITLAYNASNLVQSITDFTGRQVQYAYYVNGDAGGSAGDLKSVTSPVVTETLNGNDFPAGKTTTYTYSKGFVDPELNGNLLTITDAKGQTFVTNTYDPTTNPAAVNYDRVTRQVWGNAGDIIDLVYVPQTPAPENNNAIIRTILNDRVGNVTEYFYDALNRLVMHREFTGRADPDLPTTDSVNRPTGQLRPGDPAYFETRYSYNTDSLTSQIVHANGNITNFIYERDLNPTALPRARGNLREVHHLPGPLGGDQVEIVETYEYDATTNMVDQFVDGRGNTTTHTYDVKGNRLSTTHPIAGVVEDWEYNAFGQMTAHILPNNAGSHRRRDEFTYHASGPQLGYMSAQVVDATGLSLHTQYSYDALGRITSVNDPRGHSASYFYNSLNQVVLELAREVTNGSGNRYETFTWYDANNNIVRIDVQNRNELGAIQANAYFSTIYEYDILNALTRMCEEKGTASLNNTDLTCASFPPGKARTVEYQYDANRDRTLVRGGEAVNGNQPNNTVQTLYDERKLVFRVTRAPNDAAASSSQIDYDGNRNPRFAREGLESSPRVTTNVYDGFNRVRNTTDPMGNVVSSNYDANGNMTSRRIDGQLNDVPGGAGNVRLFESTLTYDAMNRLTRSDLAHFDTQTQAAIGDGFSSTITEYADNSQIKRITDDNGNQTNYAYDTANRLSVTTDAKNNTLTYGYDANGNIVSAIQLDRSDLGNPNQSFTTTFTYDNLDRLITKTDPSSNISTQAFDSRDLRTLATSALNRQTRNVYDPLGRLIQIIRDMNGNGASAGDPADILVSQSWDDSSRLIAKTDDNGHATSFVYDALDRGVTRQFADGTANNSTLDVHDNIVTFLDANGTLINLTYDSNDRNLSMAIAPGAGVANDTTATSFQYDGLGRRITSINNGSTVLRQFDSLSSPVSETLNGLSTTAIYDGSGNQTLCIYPGGRAISRTYDALNRPLALSDGASIATFSYIGQNRFERRSFGNGSRTDYTYDGIFPNPANDFGVRLPVRIRHTSGGGVTVLDDRSFTWDRDFNKTRRKDERTVGPRLTHDYSYDAANRLTHTTVRDFTNLITRDTNYVLDGVHNRTSVTGLNTPDAGNYTMSAGGSLEDAEMNQYTSTPAGDRTYDSNGNLTGYGGCLSGDVNSDQSVSLADVPPFISAVLAGTTVLCGADVNRDGALNGKDIRPLVDRILGVVAPTRPFELRYDFANRMVEFRDNIAPRRNTYSYDELGRRIKKVVDADGVAGGPIETRFYYDCWDEIEERNGAGLTLATYVFGDSADDIISMRRGAINYYYHADHLNNVFAVSDGTAAVVERYEYQDYGQPSFFNAAGGAIAATAIGNPLLFTSRRFDPENALYYFRTRYHDPRTGRFTTRDSIGMWGDEGNLGNGLGYVGNNPMTHADPMGLEAGYPYKLLPAEPRKLPTMEAEDPPLKPMPIKLAVPRPRPGGPPPTRPPSPLPAMVVAMVSQSGGGGGGGSARYKNYNEGRSNTRASFGTHSANGDWDRWVFAAIPIARPTGKATKEPRVQMAAPGAGGGSGAIVASWVPMAASGPRRPGPIYDPRRFDAANFGVIPIRPGGTGPTNPGDPTAKGFPACVCPISNIGSTGNDGIGIGSTGQDGVRIGSTGQDGDIVDNGQINPSTTMASGCCGGGVVPPSLMFMPMYFGLRRQVRRRMRKA